MKVIHLSVLTFVAALSRASADLTARRLHRGGGGWKGKHGHGGGKHGSGRGKHGGILAMDTTEEACERVCDAIDVDALVCDDITMPDLPDASETTNAVDARKAWADFRAERAGTRQQIQRCVCCTEATLEGIVEGMCEGVDVDALDCDGIAWPDPPEADGMDDAGKRKEWADFKLAKADVRQRINRCAKCTDATLEDLVPEGGQEDGLGGLGWDGGGGRGGLAGILGMDRDDMLEEMCEGVCEDVDKDALVCDNIARPTKPVTADMDEEEKEKACSDFMAKKKDVRRQVRRCACCTDKKLEEILPGRERGFGGRGGGRGGLGGVCRDEDGGGRFADMREEVCEGVCADVDAEALVCDDISWPAPPDGADANDEDGMKEVWAGVVAARKDVRWQIRRCACCTDASLEDLIPDGGPGWGKGKGGWGKGGSGWGKGKHGDGGPWHNMFGGGGDAESEPAGADPLGADASALAKSSLLAEGSDPATKEIHSSAGRRSISLALIVAGFFFSML